MFKDTKVISIILIFGIIVLMVSAVLSFMALKKERDEKIALQNELAQVMKERKRLSLEVEELKLIKGDFEVKLNSLEAENKMLAKNYEKEKSQNDVVRLELRKKGEEVKGVKDKLKSALNRKEELQEKLDAEKIKYDELKVRVDKLVGVKDILEEKVRDIINKQGIELERIVVKAEGELEGKVLVVNREYNFVVVDIGLRDDTELGDILTIFRNGKYIGQAKIEKIYDTMSAATITKEIKPNSIMVNDNVIVRGD